ncbi:MAG: hypothetical protein V7K98_13275 [Nostoc sp.]
MPTWLYIVAKSSNATSLHRVSVLCLWENIKDHWQNAIAMT